MIILPIFSSQTVMERRERFSSSFCPTSVHTKHQKRWKICVQSEKRHDLCRVLGKHELDLLLEMQHFLTFSVSSRISTFSQAEIVFIFLLANYPRFLLKMECLSTSGFFSLETNYA